MFSKAVKKYKTETVKQQWVQMVLTYCRLPKLAGPNP